MIKPILDRVLVKLINCENKTKSGIILNNADKSKTQIAEVLEVGTGDYIDGKKNEMYVKKGDKVLLNKYSGIDVKFEEEDFIIIKQSEILAIVE